VRMQGTVHRWGCREPYVGGDAGNLMIVGMKETIRRMGCWEPYVGEDAENCT